MKRKPMSSKEFRESFNGFYHQFNNDLSKLVDAKSPLAASAVALVLSALLEHALMSLLNRFFVCLKCGECAKCKAGETCSKNDLIFTNGTLNSFSKCADVLLRLGLITLPMRRNLEYIGRIRNRFAHSPDVIDFNDHDVKEACAQLTFPKYKVPVEERDISPTIEDPAQGSILDMARLEYADAVRHPDRRFIFVSLGLCSVLQHAAINVTPTSGFEYESAWS